MEKQQKYVLTDPENYQIDSIFNPNDQVIHMGVSLKTIKILFNPSFYFPAAQNIINFDSDKVLSIEK